MVKAAAAMPGHVVLGRATPASAAQARPVGAATEVDLVIDYLWGRPAASAIMARLLGRRTAAES